MSLSLLDTYTSPCPFFTSDPISSLCHYLSLCPTNVFPFDTIPFFFSCHDHQCRADVDLRQGGLNTPLLLAASTGNETIARLLIERGALIYARNQKDHDAVFMAVVYGHASKGCHLLRPRPLAMAEGETLLTRIAVDPPAAQLTWPRPQSRRPRW